MGHSSGTFAATVFQHLVDGGEHVAFRRQIRKIDAVFFKVCRGAFAPQRFQRWGYKWE
jgi:hypothetical protein